MATVNYALTPNKTFGNNVHTVFWTPLAKGDVGQAFRNPGWADRTVQITGTFDTATIVMEGSLDGTNWFTLSDPQGNAISKTAAALESITEAVAFIRPNVAGSGGTTALTVLLMARRP